MTHSLPGNRAARKHRDRRDRSDLHDRRPHVRPALGRIDRIVGVSTYGSKRWYVLAMNDGGRRTLTRALRLATGLRTRVTWLGMYSIDTSTDDERRAFAARVERELAAVR